MAIGLFPGRDSSLGLRAEIGDLGLSADPRSLVALLEGGPAFKIMTFVFCGAL